MKTSCPICKSSDVYFLFNSEVPTLQNRVYVEQNEAINCTKGSVDLTHCNNCNFTFNGGFDESLIVYNEHYDNAVPSKLFIQYYHDICTYLYEKYNLENGVVYDIGCGKGTFLNILCALYPSIKGVGIDPSYEGELNPRENLRFIRDFFKAEQVQEAPSLLLSRHVFEHIEYPKDFLEIIREPVQLFPDVPVFIEIPDFTWIVKNKTFWDICYEHCNYFSQSSVAAMFNYPWARLNSITQSFGEQYLWVEGIFNATNADLEANRNFPKITATDIEAFIESINASKVKVIDIVLNHKAEDYKVIVWGMATKGVIFTNSIDRERAIIDFCIDINKEKQQKYAPLSGNLIQSPQVLADFKDSSKFLVIIMNTNYTEEIKVEFANYNFKAKFINAHGEVM